MKYVVALLSSIFLAVLVASGALMTDSSVSEAAERNGDYVKTCTGGRIYLDAYERRSLALHNKIRRDHNLRPFCVDSRLTRAARAHSNDMIERDYFSHNTKGKGWDPGKRLDRANYPWRTYGENIAYGSGSQAQPEKIMRNWMNSSSHRRNILDKGFREIGIGTYTGNYKGVRKCTMYTADFGTRR